MITTEPNSESNPKNHWNDKELFTAGKQLQIEQKYIAQKWLDYLTGGRIVNEAEAELLARRRMNDISPDQTRQHRMDNFQNYDQKFDKNFENFKKIFSEKAVSIQGSGWCWLVFNETYHKIEIITTANQDSPRTVQKTPLLGLDMWEHAYYLKYQNKRPDYINAWWNLVNWAFVEKKFAEAKRLKSFPILFNCKSQNKI